MIYRLTNESIIISILIKEILSVLYGFIWYIMLLQCSLTLDNLLALLFVLLSLFYRKIPAPILVLIVVVLSLFSEIILKQLNIYLIIFFENLF